MHWSIFVVAGILLAACSSAVGLTDGAVDLAEAEFTSNTGCEQEPADQARSVGSPEPEPTSIETASSVPAGDDVPPNIVLIMTDDQNWQSINCMPIVTERISGQGLTFENAFVTSPNCCPARAGFFTGDYVADHGVFTNALPQGGAAAYSPSGSFPEILGAQGYTTGLFGKYLTSYRSEAHGAPIGFDRYLVLDDASHPDRRPETLSYFNWAGTPDDGSTILYGDSDEDYSTDVFGEAARDFIAEAGDAPFFLQYSPFAPHRPATLPARHVDLAESFQRTEFPPNYGVVPQDAGWTNELRDRTWTNTRQPEVESVRSQQIASLQSVDENVGILLDELEANGQLDNTVVIFTSDNGFAWGEHRWLHKLCAYEACIRVPLVIADFRPDGATSQTRGSVDSRIVTNLDVAATIADLAGSFDAQVMPAATPIDLGEPTSPVRSQFLIENYTAGNGAQPLGQPAFQGVRTETHKYVRYPDGQEELFLLQTDPFELVNEIASPDETNTVEELRQTVDDSFPTKLRRETWVLDPSDICLGDGDPIEADFPGDLPPVNNILSMELRIQTDREPDLEVRQGFDLVSPRAGWNIEAEIALPPRVIESTVFKLPAATGFIGQLDADNFDNIQIEAEVEPSSPLCLSGALELNVDYLFTE